MGIIRPLKNIYHLVEAYLANAKYGFPSRKIKVIGVTGTDGKTTTSHMIYHILKHAGYKVSITSTVFSDVAGNISDTGLHVTTQNRWKIQKNLLDAVKNGDMYFVLEVTSHALDQYRAWGITFDVGVLTNITHEHLDYHKTYKNYLRAKCRLFAQSTKAVINKDDMSHKQVLDFLKKKRIPHVEYSIKSKADYTWNNSQIISELKEEYNHENMMAAWACCRELGISEETIRAALAEFKLPKGRLDTVYDNGFKVVIDFAHTGNSLKKLLPTLRPDKGRLIHVFGCPGLRDTEKRLEMGVASGTFASITIVTEEDYRTESFDQIVDKIEEGLKRKRMRRAMKEDAIVGTYVVIKDRQEAIDYAVSIARHNDVIACTGKGHEKSLARGKKEHPWDEYKAVEQAISKLLHE